MTRPIVAGVDGSEPALRAAAWAGREAALRNAPLRLLHAAPRWEHDVPLAPSPAWWRVTAHAEEEETERLLAQAAEAARAAGGEPEVTTEVAAVPAREALASASADAQLVVVGGRGLGGIAGLLLGSVSGHLIHRAACPVVVVRGQGRWTGDVVVGVTGRPEQDPVLEFAFQEAALHGARLRAVHAWRHPAVRGPGDMQPPAHDMTEVGQEEERLLAESLTGRRARHPDVPLLQEVVHGSAAHALIQASARAGLVVIGAHDGLRQGTALGSVAHAVTCHAQAPVAVVR